MAKDFSAVSRRTGMRTRYKGSRQFRSSRLKYRTSRSRIPGKVSGLSKQVKELKRLAESDMGTHIHRLRQSENLICGANLQNSISISGNSLPKVEAVLAQLRYYDPSNPGTLLQASGTAGTFQKDFFFTRIHCKIIIRNNYQVPAKVSVYACVPRDDTSQTVLASFVSGIADVGNPPITDPMVYLTDSKLFTDLWRIEDSKKLVLQPGAQCVVPWNGKPFQFDPSTADVHNLLYQRLYQAMNYMIFVSGVPAHDATLDEQGTVGAGVDMILDSMWEVKYPAGADITFITVDNQSNPFTNQALVSNKPIADNQGYSQA